MNDDAMIGCFFFVCFFCIGCVFFAFLLAVMS